MERKIGEIFEYNGEWYQAIDNTHDVMCSGCTFVNDYNDCEADISVVSNCRCKDGNPLIFKKLVKVEEPYIVHDHSMDKDLIIQDYKLYSLGACYTGHDILDFCPHHGKTRGIVAIEIKQNKENMEENKIPLPKVENALTRAVYAYISGKTSDKELIKSIKEMSDEYPYDKSNLKPFSLEAAKSGKPVCTRDGRKARIICFDFKSSHPIVALGKFKEDSDEEWIGIYDENGKAANDKNSNYDLMMLSKKKVGWINVYNSLGVITFSHNPYDTKEEALEGLKSASGKKYHVDTIKISWEE